MDPPVNVAHADDGRPTSGDQRCRGCPDVAETLGDNARGAKGDVSALTGQRGSVKDAPVGCFGATFRPADAGGLAGDHTRIGMPNVQ